MINRTVMKKLSLSFFLVISVCMFSCNNPSSNKTRKPSQANLETNKPDTIDPAVILIDFRTWYKYNEHNISLSQDFVGLDVNSKKISKTDFLNHLLTGHYVPINMMVKNRKQFYKLYKINKPNLDIQNTIKQLAATEIAHYEMEGKELPAFSFTDLNGRIYNKTTTKGKVLVIKCWFIHCAACIKEFPQLNQLVEKNKDRDDILFISLAIDSKQDLISFLKKQEFKYAVVPEMESYMNTQLKIRAYPTHILVDKNGKIIKVVNAVENLIPFI